MLHKEEGASLREVMAVIGRKSMVPGTCSGKISKFFVFLFLNLALHFRSVLSHISPKNRKTKHESAQEIYANNCNRVEIGLENMLNPEFSSSCVQENLI